ncbi:ER membrane protein complex subunit 4-like protein [Tanacetum coccineum]|uniref:ER membrane protein complex subunit 4 n=2 Tax=Tanacetum TaxID=99105 RepID=A0ABQ5HNW4_9ASTR
MDTSTAVPLMFRNNSFVNDCLVNANDLSANQRDPNKIGYPMSQILQYPQFSNAGRIYRPLEFGLRLLTAYDRSELGIHDHDNEPSSSKLVPKVVPSTNKTDTSRQELELLFHHHITMLSGIMFSSDSFMFYIVYHIGIGSGLQMEKGKGVMGSRKWAVDFTDNSSTPSTRDIPDPPGFTRASQDQDDSAMSRQKKDAEANWKSQKAWEVAQAPFKNLLMMGFMMWMAGSTVHLFSIGITFSALWQPLSALQGVGKVFEPYKDSKVDLLAPKLLFIALNLGGMLLGVWKLNTLGLLPTHASDWVSSLPPAHEVEFSGGGIALH